MIADAKLIGRFALPGFRNDLDQMLPSADLFVSSSLTEGMPNVLLEAAAASLPVVATAVGGTPEVVVAGETGYLVPADDPAKLAERITQLLRDEELRHRMGRAGREHVRTNFTFEAQAQTYLRLFEEFGLVESLTQRAAA